MPIIVLIPALICAYALFRDSVYKAVLNVYLPVLMCLPIYYFWKVALLPPLDFGETVLFPIGVAILISQLPRWRPSLIDLALIVFIVSSFYADFLANRQTTYIFDLFKSICNAVIPYMIGKLLIEQNRARILFVKRILILLFFTCLIAPYEFFLHRNPFAKVFDHLFAGETFAWTTQIRWGFGRASGPFAQSELAGIILSTGICLTLWLSYYGLWEPHFTRFRRWPLSKSKTIILLFFIVLFMTGARGPWLGLLFALPIAFIGRARNVGRSAVITTLLVVILGGGAYVGLKRYTAGPTTDSEQQTAQYRANLVDNYKPVVIQGGLWGWGKDFPIQAGQNSIDNEYLFLAITQGWAGLFSFGAIALLTLIRMITAAAIGPTRPDRYFAFTLLGAFAGILFTVTTVYLGLQAYQIFFLLVGWSQALPLRPEYRTQLAFDRVAS